MLGIFLTIFFDMLGFGLLIPDIQIRGKELAVQQIGSAADSHQVFLLTGLALASFSFAQLVTSPILGRLSDRVGRRKILLITTLLAGASYLVYAHATSYPLMVVSRVFAGIAAANIGVAFAYIADITTTADRAKGMGAVGAAFGLGFIFGPPFGVILLKVGHDNPAALGYPAAILAILNFLYVLLFLEESNHEGKEHEQHFFADFKQAFKTPGLSLLLIMFFAANFGFTNLETTFIQLLGDPRTIFHLGDKDAKFAGGILLGFVGIIAAIMQGMVVRKVTAKYGEAKVLRFTYFIFIPCLMLIPFSPLWVPMLMVQVVLGIAMGLTQPNISALISKSAPKQIQGGIFGITQALGGLARCIGPLISNSMFAWKPYAPYFLGATIILFPAFAAWQLKDPSRQNGESVSLH